MANPQYTVKIAESGDRAQMAVKIAESGDRAQMTMRVARDGDHPQMTIKIAESGDHARMTVILDGGLVDPATPALPYRTLTFSDEFNGATLDLTKWTNRPPFDLNGGGSATTAEIQANVPEAITLANGKMLITASKTSAYGLEYSSGCPTTYGIFSQSYGRWEVSVKLPGFHAQWPGVWLLPSDPTLNQNASQFPEIDLFENIDNIVDNMELTYHKVGGLNSQVTIVTGQGFLTGYHTIAVEWDINVVSWFLDGVLRHQAFVSVSGEPLYMLLQNSVGESALFTTPVEDAALPSSMYVEYARVYTVETPPTGLPSFSTISDDFADGTKAAIWDSVADSGTTIAETGSQLVCTPKTDAERQTLYTYYQTVDRYDLTGASVYVKVVQAAENAAGPVYTRFVLANHLFSTIVLMYVTAGQLRMRYKSFATETDVATVSYSAVTHAWWRIREASGTIYWDTSTNGIAWTNRASVSAPFAVTALRCQIGILSFDDTNTPSPATSIFSNFNTPPATTSRVTSSGATRVTSDGATRITS